jgi:ABC-type uncharacterized transport system substrate-binding protein
MIHTMKSVALLLVAAATIACMFATPARAHPHVWVTITSQILYDDKGEATGVRQAWEFDDMYTAFALEGLPQKTKGVYTREELAGLADVNITNLKEEDFFTFVKVNGKEVPFGDAADYWLEYNKDLLTLYFTLPFKTPLKEKQLTYEVYDPTYFVDFGFADKDAIKLVGAPAKCKTAIEQPKDPGAGFGQQFMSDEQAITMMDNWGASFASKIVVTCP